MMQIFCTNRKVMLQQTHFKYEIPNALVLQVKGHGRGQIKKNWYQ